jgi:uncharacterized UPF0146 family protein
MVPAVPPRALLTRYAGARKVVEVGVGSAWLHALEAARALPGCEVWVTDVDPRVREAPAPLRAAVDDALRPTLELYEGAALVLAVRAPEELQAAASHVAHEVGADLAVLPLGGELATIDAWPRHDVVEGWHWFHR